MEPPTISRSALEGVISDVIEYVPPHPRDAEPARVARERARKQRALIEWASTTQRFACGTFWWRSFGGERVLCPATAVDGEAADVAWLAFATHFDGKIKGLLNRGRCADFGHVVNVVG